MRTSYEIPEMDVTVFATENVIVTSGGDGWLNNGGPDGEWNEDLGNLFP